MKNLKTKTLQIFFTLFTLTTGNCLYGTDSISVSGSPATFSVTAAVAAGQGLQPIGNSSTTYSVTIAAGSAKLITGAISAAVANGYFQIDLTAPSGATSAGFVTLSTTAQNLVTAIPGSTNSTGLVIGYIFAAYITGAQVSNVSVTLTLTVT